MTIRKTAPHEGAFLSRCARLLNKDMRHSDCHDQQPPNSKSQASGNSAHDDQSTLCPLQYEQAPAPISGFEFRSNSEAMPPPDKRSVVSTNRSCYPDSLVRQNCDSSLKLSCGRSGCMINHSSVESKIGWNEALYDQAQQPDSKDVSTRKRLCGIPGCMSHSTETHQPQKHTQHHEMTIHRPADPTHNCQYHDGILPRSYSQPPGWVATLSQWPATSRSTLRHHTIPAAHGFALTLKPGAHLRIVDLHGQQVVDFMSWALPFQADSSCEHFSASYTRYRLGGSAPPQIGECLYSNRDRPMFKILEDKVKCHDMLFMACNPSFYDRLGKSGHRSCASNIAEAMADEGFDLVDGKKGKEGWSGVHDPFNVFQNTPYYSLKALECSRKGDWIEMKVCDEMEHGVVVALSSCPYEEKGFNGGKVTDVGVVWEAL